MSSIPRIGLTQRVVVDARTGERRDCLDQRWSELLWAWGFLPLPLPNRGIDPAEVRARLHLDGVILTGGNDLSSIPDAQSAAPERDDFENRLLDACRAAAVPVLGVCRGLQLLAQRNGASLTPIQGHVAVTHAISCTQDVPVLPLQSIETVNSYHGFGILADGLSEDTLVVAVDDSGYIEALANQHRKECGIMWHPERGKPTQRDRTIFNRLFGGESTT